MEHTPPRLAYGVNAVMLMEYIIPSLHIETPTDMTVRRALEEGIVQLEELEEECLGPDEEIQQGNLKIQELMNERVRLREKSTMVEEEVKNLEKGIKDFFYKKTLVIKQDAHDYVEEFGDYH